MRTISEINKHPETITKEEAKVFLKTLRLVKELGKQTEGYNIKIQSDNTSDLIYSNFYQEHFAMSAILEAFLNKNEINFKDLNEFVFNRVPKEVLDVPITYYQNIILKMIRMGLITSTSNENDYLPIFEITDAGIDALAQQTFQSLAASSFYNFQTNKLNIRSLEINKRSLRMNLFMLIVTIGSIVVTIFAVLKK